jgi:xanthine dehydrogenase accessory factor
MSSDSVLKALADLPQNGTAAALCTIIRVKGSTPRKTGAKMLVYQDGSFIGTIGGGEIEARVVEEAVDAILSGESKILSFDLIDPQKGDPGVCGGTQEIFIDPLKQPQDLIVIGGGHVGKAVVHLGSWLGFRVILSDDREEYCQPEKVPGANEYIHCNISDLPDKYRFTPRSAIVLATRSNQVDIEGLPELLEGPFSYLGVISSRRRWKLTQEELVRIGISEKRLDQIRAPIGLDIKAETPEEIALSILAEIIQSTRGGTGKSLS